MYIHALSLSLSLMAQPAPIADPHSSLRRGTERTGQSSLTLPARTTIRGAVSTPGAVEPTSSPQRPLPAANSRTRPIAQRTSTGSILFATSALAIGLLTWAGIARRWQGRVAVQLPTHIIESLGQFTLPGGKILHLVHFGSKLVLLTVDMNRVQPIAEITDPQEVERVIRECTQQKRLLAGPIHSDLWQRLASWQGNADDMRLSPREYSSPRISP